MSDDGRPLIYVSLDSHWAYRLGWDWLTYKRLIRRAGGRARTVHYHRHGDLVESLHFDPSRQGAFDGLLLGGGTDVDPAHYREEARVFGDGDFSTKEIHGSNRRDEFELQLIRHSLSVGRPILGICRGCQLLNVALGGTLKRLSANRFHRHVTRCWKHPVIVRRGSRFADMTGRRRIDSVRSVHNEVVERPGSGVVVVARSPDGVPEAIEVSPTETTFCIGVQWHPELMMWGNHDLPLVQAFVDASRRFRDQSRGLDRQERNTGNR